MIDAGYHCITLDLRGHGESEWSPEANYRLSDYVGDLNAVVSTLPRPPVLVGASLGGVTSLIAAGENASTFASALVLVDVVPRMESEGVNEVRDFMKANPEGFASIEAAAEAVSHYLPKRPMPSNIKGLRKNLVRRDNGRYYWHWDPKMHPANNPRVDSMQAMCERMESAARNISIPTLIVRGGISRVVSTEGVDQLRKLIPQANYVDVVGAGHMVAGDRNDEFNDEVERFLLGLRPRGN